MTRPRPLSPCGRGSCVSTQASRTDPLRRIEPLAFAATPETVMAAILTVLGRTAGARILERDAVAVHAVLRSRWLRLPVDVELRVDAASDTAAGVVHLRVAAPLALREGTAARARALGLLAALDREIRRG